MVPQDNPDEERAQEVPSARHCSEQRQSWGRPGSGGTEPAMLSCPPEKRFPNGQSQPLLPLTCPLCPTDKIPASDSTSWALEVALRCFQGPPLPRLKQPWSTSHGRQHREPIARPPWVTHVQRVSPICCQVHSPI